MLDEAQLHPQRLLVAQNVEYTASQVAYSVNVCGNGVKNIVTDEYSSTLVNGNGGPMSRLNNTGRSA